MSGIKAAVIGAQGRMGREAVQALGEAEGIELVAALRSSDPLERLVETGAEVAVELTVPAVTERNVAFLVRHGIHAVVGTTGWDEAALARIRAQLGEEPRTAVLVAPNFSIGAVLAMRFAELAAPYFESAEVVEIHHPAKLDAPSGTAAHTARRIAAARTAAGLGAVPDATETDEGGARGAVVDGIHVHALRQRGRVAHEEIHFGAEAEALTIRTDSFNRGAFMPGVVHSVREAHRHPGLTVGLEHYLDL